MSIRFLRGWRPVFALAAATVVIGAGVPLLSSIERDADPADLVRDYLAAVEAKDVPEALRLAGTHPTGESARFLTDAALADGWRVLEVAEAETEGGTASVSATLTTDDGSHATGEFTLAARPDGTWRLVNPFAEVRFAATPMDFTEVNGVIAPATRDTPLETYLLLPGAYRFHATSASLVHIDAPGTPLLPGEPVVVPAQLPGLTQEGVASVREAVEDHIDACAAGQNDLWTRDCPFSTTGYVGELTGDGYLFDPVDVSWTVTEYPDMEFGVDGGAVVVTAYLPGKVTLKATGKEDPDEAAEHDIEAGCEIQVDGLRAVLTADGTWRIGYDPDADGSRAWRPGTIVDTCAV